MSIEQEMEGLSVTAGDHGNIDPEHIWGGEIFEWFNWEKAERCMGVAEYNVKQMEEANGFKTREAFMMVMGREPIMNNDGHGSDELVMFFISKGGAKYFKRRNFQYRKDVSKEEIAKYYQNKEWEKE